MIKSEPISRLQQLGEQPSRRLTKAKLEAMLNAAEQKQSKPTALKGVKATLFEMYTENPDLAVSKEELMAALPGRKWSSIATLLGGGLGSETYGMKVDGEVQPILIARDGKGLYRRTL